MLETSYYLRESLNGTNGLDIDEERRIIEDKLKELKSDNNANDKTIKLAMKDLGMQRANHYGWPNTYVLTKALGEMIIGHLKGDMPVVILRPTIVTSTFKEPISGWVEGVRTIDSLTLGYGKGHLTCFLGNPDAVYDVHYYDLSPLKARDDWKDIDATIRKDCAKRYSSRKSKFGAHSPDRAKKKILLRSIMSRNGATKELNKQMKQEMKKMLKQRKKQQNDLD